MNEQLQKRVKELLYELGCEVDQNLSNLSDEELYGYSQMLTDRLLLVCKLVRLKLKSWQEACEYVGNLSYDEVQAELQLSDDNFVQKFEVGRRNNDGSKKGYKP